MVASGRKIAARRFIVHRKSARDQHLSPNLTGSFIDRSRAVWNFHCDGQLYPLSLPDLER
jgi:hypothetical protein